MNWDAIGAIAELLGATGVIGSLIYLSFQIRQNSLDLKESAKRATQTSIYQQNLLNFENLEAYELIQRGMEEAPDFSDSDRGRFHNYWMTAFINYQEAFKSVRGQRTDDDFWNIIEHHIRIYLSTPGLARWWQKNAHVFNEEFVAYLNGESKP